MSALRCLYSRQFHKQRFRPDCLMNSHEQAVRKLLSFVLSVGLMTVLVLLLWIIDVTTQAPEIPWQTPDVSYFEIILHKKKKNPIDDLYPVHAIPRVVN